MKHDRHPAIRLLAGSLLLLLAACGPSNDQGVAAVDRAVDAVEAGDPAQRTQRDTPADRAVEAGILLLNNGTEPKGLDPHLVTGVPENRIISALIEGLVTYHPTDDTLPEPGMAESWEHDRQFRNWTFRLRDARWSNGDPVTAQDFAFSYERILTPALGAEYANMLYVVEGAEAFHRGENKDFASVGVEVIDDRTLRIRLVGPTPYFLTMLKHYSWFPVHRDTVLKHGAMTDRDNRWTRVGNYVGNGPFVLSEWKPNARIEVTKSPTYWDRQTVRLNAIRFFPIENPNSDELSFLSGESHYASTMPADKIPYHRQNHPDLIRIEPYLGTYFYRINVTRPPFDDPRVREALAYAVDREQIVRWVTKGNQIPAQGFTPPGINGYTVPEMVGLDVERAREALTAAGYPGGRGFPEAEILINTSENHRRVAEAIQEMWRRSLGIEVSIRNEEWKVYLESQSQLRYTLSRAGWIGDYVDPITFLEMWTTGNGNNDTGWSNARFDALIQQAMRAEDQAEHFTLLREAESILLSELPVIPIYIYTRIYMIDPRVRGWHPKLLDNRPYKYIHFGS